MNRYFKTALSVLIAGCFNAAELHAGMPSKAIREGAELAVKASAPAAGTAARKAAAQYGDDALKAMDNTSAALRRPSRISAKPDWKQLMAVGFSAGTVVAAYKISDGVQTGIETVAEKHPETFGDTVTSLLAPIKWSILAFLLILLYPLGVLSWRAGKKLRSKRV